MKIKNRKKLENYLKIFQIRDLVPEEILQVVELFIFEKNQFIYREGEKIPYLYFFVEGKAKVYITLSNGKSLLLCFYEDFKVLGDVELIHQKLATSNVVAIEETYCIGIPYEVVQSKLLNDAKFLRFICSSLADKLSRNSTNSSINLLNPLENRVASYILTSRGKKESNDTIVIRENLTELASLLGTSYRHLLRTLSNLCEKGILGKEKDAYVVIDKKGLEGLSTDYYKQ